MWHASALPPDFVGREAVIAILDVVVDELGPLAATFFSADGEQIRSSVVHGPDAAAAELVVDSLGPATLAKAQGPVLTEAPPLGAAGRLRAVGDLHLLIRDGGKPVAGLTLWRPLGGDGWSEQQLRLAGALQPLVELGYVCNVRGVARIDAELPATVTGRQRQVARLLAAGATTPEIARSLFVSPNTAKSHTRAVMAKLGVTSRRELAMRFAQEPELHLPARADAGPSSRLEGDRGPAGLLDAVLQWSAERLGAELGGCALLSTRLELIAEAWGTTARASDLRLAWRLHRQLLGQADSPEVVRYLDADRAQRRVAQLDLTDLPARDELDELLANAGLASPLVAALRAHGRVAGLVWLCRDAKRGPDVSESARALRGVHPLIELANATHRAHGRRRTTGAADLAELGLTPREIAVVRLAVTGKANSDIAVAMGISDSTVKKHMTRILAKCGVRSRTQLIAMLRDG